MIFARLGLIALLQTGVLLSMVWDRAAILNDGTPILLKTEPVDPRSLFRGYYVDLNYEINRLELARLEGDMTFERWQTIFVALEKQNGYWSATSAFGEWPSVIGDQVIIQGTIERLVYEDNLCGFDDDASCKIKSLIVRYGIDSYFIPEGDGKKIEDMMRDNREEFRIGVSVDSEGKAAIRGLLLKGDWIYEEPAY